MLLPDPPSRFSTFFFLPRQDIDYMKTILFLNQCTTSLFLFPPFSPLQSKVAEDLLFLAPVHRGRSLLVTAGEGLLFGLSSCRTQTQPTVHERVRNTPVVLIRDLQYTQTCMFLFVHSPPSLFLSVSPLLSHLDAHVRAADL